MDRTWMALCVTVIAAMADGKIFEPVELAQKLHSVNVSDWDIPSLVCLAHNASRLNTSHTEVLPAPPGLFGKNYTFYGVFGIPDVWLHFCGLSPINATDEDIEDDVICVINGLSTRVSEKRNYHLAVLTPHDVDLKKCFNWWESLSRYMLSTNEHFEVPQCPPTAAALTDSHHLSSTHKPHPPVTTTCQCDTSNGGVIVDISLLLLNMIFVALCFILWKSFVRRRTVKSDTVEFFQ